MLKYACTFNGKWFKSEDEMANFAEYPKHQFKFVSIK